MKKILILMAAVVLSCTTAVAQRNGGNNRRGQMSQEEIAKMRSENIKRQAESLAKDMKLAKDKQADFITDYTAYQEELQAAQGTFDMSAFGSREEQKKVKDMTDDECLEKVTAVISRAEEQAKQANTRLEVTKKWVAKFLEKEYTAQQLYQIFAEVRRTAGGQGGQGAQGGMRMGGGAGGFGGGFPGGGAGGFGGGFGGGF